LEKYFGIREGGMQIRKFANGQSNPTYHIRLMSDSHEFVLRKKPVSDVKGSVLNNLEKPGKLLPSAHRIEREFRVQKALKGSLPVPKMIDFVEKWENDKIL
jgi:aminoglycoside phosphotransferase (APT) family kinase protein